MQRYPPGLPPIDAFPSKVQFSNLVDRMRDRLHGWKSRTLTFAGRLTLIKSVTTAISNHVCSCFKIPQSVIDKMEGLKPHFLWSSGERDKTHMVSWSRVCRPTEAMKLGIRPFAWVNWAFMAKLLWRLLTATNFLWVLFLFL